MQQHACDLTQEVETAPCTIVIFGATGDLTRRKLIPALYALFCQGSLPQPFSIVGCSRTSLNHQEFRNHLAEHLDKSRITADRWEEFADNLFYHPLQYEQESFEELAAYLTRLDQERNTRANRIFDLAVPPHLYPVIAELLGRSGLSREKEDNRGWARIIIEKPFGRDLETARSLDATLLSHFKEEQVFRIDHYLAKETVQNTLILRFANIIFEPIWNRNYIDHIGIVAAEEIGVGSRAGYYDKAGVIRDMFQNHLMQLLVLTAMEPPSSYTATAVQDEKAKVIRSLREFDQEKGSRLTLGQYSAGKINDEPVAAYRDEPDIAADSLTPTFALMQLFIDNWRWHNVPFYLASGKRLPRKETRIIIHFRQVPHHLFQNVLGDTINANRLVIETYPEEAIRLHFQTKAPGKTICLRTMTMDFAYHQHYKGKSLDDYARVLLDCMAGDHMLFWRQDGIELSWEFLTPVLEECEQCPDRAERLHMYPAGTWGPEESRDTLQHLAGE